MNLTAPMIVLDTETGGLDPAVQSILSLAASPFGTVGGHFHVFIKEPEIVANQSALNINKIDLDWLRAHGVEPAPAVLALETYLTGLFGPINPKNRIVLIGHNVGFDVGFLKRLYRMAGQEKRYDAIYSYRTLDTAAIARFLILAGVLPLTEASGAALGKFFKCEPTTEHDALADAISTWHTLRHLIRLVTPWWKRLLG